MTIQSGLALLLVCTRAIWAQYVVSARAGTINFTRGDVTVDGQRVQRNSLRFPSLNDGQVLRTSNGRAEILLGPGVFLRLGEQGALRMLDARLVDTQVEVQQGSALIEVVEMAKDSNVHVRLGVTLTAFKGMGLHRFDTGAKELRVFGGHAEVLAGDQKVEAGRGKLVHLDETLSVSKFDRRQVDALHQWAARRSFLIFAANLPARPRRSNWEITRLAWVWNRDFGMMFYSRAIARGYRGPGGGP